MKAYTKSQLKRKMDELRKAGVKDSEMGYIEKDNSYVIVLATKTDVSHIAVH